MKVLITGGAGFIGSNLADFLVARGDQVFIIDNFVTGRRDNLPVHPNLRLSEGSIADADFVSRVFDEVSPERVVHAAASYKDPTQWMEDALTNVLGTVNVVKAAVRKGVSRLIYFKTSLCYGLHPRDQPITLDSPIQPYASSYAISKTAAEQYIMLSGLDFISLRLANAYGPRNLSGPLPTFFHRISHHQPIHIADTRRDFIFIQDLLAVVVKALDGQGQKGMYHVSSGKDVSVKELFDAIVKAMGITLEKEVPVQPRSSDDAYTILLECAKTNADFAWKVTTSLEQGVRAAVDWYRTHEVRETFTHLSMGTKS